MTGGGATGAVGSRGDRSILMLFTAWPVRGSRGGLGSPRGHGLFL